MSKVYSTDSILRASHRFHKLAQEKSPTQAFADANKCSEDNELFVDFLKLCVDRLKIMARKVSSVELELGVKESLMPLLSEALQICTDNNEDGLLMNLERLHSLNLFEQVSERLNKYMVLAKNKKSESIEEEAHVAKKINGNVARFVWGAMGKLKDLQEQVNSRMESPFKLSKD